VETRFDLLAKAAAGAIPWGAALRQFASWPRGPTRDRGAAFDRLAKALAEEVPRREALRRVSVGLTATLLASLGLERAWGQGNSTCAHWCRDNFPPGPARGACTSQAARGGGPCYACGPAGDNRGLCPGNGQGGVCCTGGKECVNGVCQCPLVKAECSGVCVDTATDPHNCGQCGQICGADEQCCSGVCADDTDSHPFRCGPTCQRCDLPREGCCSGVCTDIRNNQNCGACGLQCAPGETCTTEPVTGASSTCVVGFFCGGTFCCAGETCVAGSGCLNANGTLYTCDCPWLCDEFGLSSGSGSPSGGGRRR
jgi:hypothetical protein